VHRPTRSCDDRGGAQDRAGDAGGTGRAGTGHIGRCLRRAGPGGTDVEHHEGTGDEHGDGDGGHDGGGEHHDGDGHDGDGHDGGGEHHEGCAHRDDHHDCGRNDSPSVHDPTDGGPDDDHGQAGALDTSVAGADHFSGRLRTGRRVGGA